MSFRKGDRVIYRPSSPGDYGYDRDVPAVFIEAGKKRWSIDVLLKDGTRKRISVHPKNVRRDEGDEGR